MERAPQEFDVEALDAYIFPQFSKAKVSVISDVNPDKTCLTEGKEDFISEKTSEVVLTYKKNSDIWYDQSEIILLDLKLELKVRRDVPEFIREQYIWAINEKIAKIRMLRETQAAAKGNDIELHMKRFQRYADFIYGVPTLDIFNGVINRINIEISKDLKEENISEDVKNARKRITEIIINFKANNTFKDVLNISDVQEDDESVITEAEDLKVFFEKAIIEYGLSDWSVDIDKAGTRTAIAIVGDSKKVKLPSSSQLEKRSTKRKLTHARIKGLIAHEIGTHALRKKNGHNSQIKLLGTGLDRYEQGEEGLATYREQKETNFNDYAGLEAYFAIGLAKGLDGGPKRNFVQVHKILTDYFTVVENTDIVRAKELAWNQCVRIFRGTTGTIPGVVFSKDLIYRHGNISHWQAMASGNLDDVDLDKGKFDPTNPRHILFLSKLTALNQEVEGLETRE